MSTSFAYLGLGGNVGNVRDVFKTVLQRLQGHESCAGIRTSKLYRTEPWGLKDQPEFLNLVAELEWNGSLWELADFTHRIEHEEGRIRSEGVRWGPRRIDIDILLFADWNIESPSLSVPHPQMHIRRFVLVPLADLAPDLVPPGCENTVRDILAGCEDEGRVEALTEEPWGSGPIQVI